MKLKKILFSGFIICLVCLLVIGGVYSSGRKRPIEAKEMASAEVIEYEVEEDANTGNSAQEDNQSKNESDVKPTSGEVEDIVEKVSICVFGKSKVSLTPDSALVFARIESFNEDMVKSKQDNFSAFEKVINALKAIGIDENDIVLDNFNCYPQREGCRGCKILGYESTTRFSVKLNSLDKIKECVDVLAENGVTDICDINYKVSNLDEEYNNTLTSAVENAKVKAAKLLGREDLKIVSVKEEYVYSCNNIYRSYAEDLSASDLVGKVEIEAQVLVEFN